MELADASARGIVLRWGCTLDKVSEACLVAVSRCGSAAAISSPAPFLVASHEGPAPSYTAACALASN